MPLSKSAIVSAIRGAFVADASSMGTHWIYDPQEMAKQVPSLEKPEFKDPPTPSFYSSVEFPGHYGPGMLSPYGEQLLFVTEHLIATGGIVDGPTMSSAMMEWSTNQYTGRKDSAMKTFEENMKHGNVYPNCGADDYQAHCYMKVIPVTCLYAGKPELLDKVEEAIRVHQNNDVAVSFGCAAALILERVLLGRKDNDDYATFVEQWNIPPAQDAWNKASTYTDLESLFLSLSHELMKGKEDSPFYNFAARSCALPGAFIGPAFLLQQLQKQQNQCLDDTSQNAFTTTIQTNILGAGDTCSRAIFLGAVVAAGAADDDGDDSSIPEEWIQKMDIETMKRINAAAEAIANLSNATE